MGSNQFPIKSLYDTKSFYRGERNYLKKCLGPSAFLLLGCLSGKAMNSAKQNRYCRVGTVSWDQVIQLNNTHLARTLGRHPENLKRDKPMLLMHSKSLCSSHLTFCLLLASMWCIHIVVLPQPQLGRNPVLFCPSDYKRI